MKEETVGDLILAAMIMGLAVLGSSWYFMNGGDIWMVFQLGGRDCGVGMSGGSLNLEEGRSLRSGAISVRKEEKQKGDEIALKNKAPKGAFCYAASKGS